MRGRSGTRGNGNNGGERERWFRKRRRGKRRAGYENELQMRQMLVVREDKRLNERYVLKTFNSIDPTTH